MTRYMSLISYLAAACLLALLAGCERQAATPSSTPTTTLKKGSLTIEYEVVPSILMEAENGQITAPMTVFEDHEASRGKYVMTPEGPAGEEINHGGEVVYRLDVAAPGEYVLWCRARWAGACGNSLDILLDTAGQGFVEDPVYEVWHWVALRRKLKLDAGEHFLVIGNREDGSAVDQVLLTQDPDYRPTDIELLDAPGRTSALAPFVNGPGE